MALGAVLLVLGTSALSPHGGGDASDEDCQAGKEDDVSCDWAKAAMPGVFGTTLLLAGRSRPYVGGGIQLIPVVWASDRPGGGPGRGALFAAAGILNASDDPHSLGLFEMGATLSLEAAPRRTFAIPFWGFSVGSLMHAKLPEAGYGQALLGAHLLFLRQLTADLQVGYHYPFKDIDTLRGPRAQLTLRSAFW